MTSVFEMRRHEPRRVFDLRDRFQEERWADPADDSPRKPVAPRGRIRLVAEARLVNGIEEPLPTALELVTTTTSLGHRVWHGRTRASEDGVVRRGGFEPGVVYVVRVRSRAYLPARVDLPLGDAPQLEMPPVGLYPSPSYPFEAVDPLPAGSPLPSNGSAPVGRGPTLIRGRLRLQGESVADRVVVLALAPNDGPSDEALPARTADDGQWVLVVIKPQDDMGSRVVRFDGATPHEADQVLLVRGRETRFQQTSVRGRVIGAAGLPLSGALVTVDGDPALSAESDRDGEWSVAWPPGAHPPGQSITASVTAVAPDGSTENQIVLLTTRREHAVDFTFV